MKLLFAGDFCPFDGYEVKFDASLKERFSDADFSFVNLECPLTDSKEKISKCGPNLKASPRQISVLKDLGANCVTLANNHLLDYGGNAVLETLRLCKQNKIQTVGAGENLDAARRILLLEKHGIKVGILNVAEREFSIAGDNSPGANPLDLIYLLRDLKHAREVSDKIVIVVHGGLEHVRYPSPESVRLMRFLAEQSGVAAIIRHHSHVIQGCEYWNGVPIYYGLGNFYFPHLNMGHDWHRGLLVEIEIDGDDIIAHHTDVRVIPDAPYKNMSVEVCSGVELPEVSGPNVEKIWREEFANRKCRYLTWIFSPWAIWRRVASKVQVLRWLPPSSSQLLIFEDYLFCPAHREVVLKAIERSSESC